MSRALGNIWKVRNLFSSSRRSCCFEVKKLRELVRAGSPSSFCKQYVEYICYGRGNALIISNKAKANLYGCNFKKFSAFLGSNAVAFHFQIAWKRISQNFFCSSSVSTPVSKIACAVGLALTRSNIIAPGVFSFIIGEVTWSQMTSSNSEYFPVADTIYRHARNGHTYLISFVLSAFGYFVLLVRAIYLAILFSPAVAMAPFLDYSGIWFRKTWLNLVRSTLEKAGPAFIKWGQWAATRPDLFPRDLCTELAKLQTSAPAHSFSYSKKSIEKAFGRKIYEIFDDFEEAPIASGSIAQVHRAILRLRHQGKRVKPVMVAVKVRHPGVQEAIKRDFVIIHLVSQTLKFIPTVKWLRVDESVEQFAVFMISQVDLSREAVQLSRFIYNFRNWKDVSFPTPIYPLVHPAVLVETYEKGESVSRFVDGLEGNDRIKTVLAHIGTHALLKMLLVDNFIHADMHPGNILVRVAEGKSSRKRFFKSRPHIIFLDVGMTAELSRNDRAILLDFFKAVALRDGRTAAECTLRFSKQQNCPNPGAFIEVVDKSFAYWGTPEGDAIHPAECIQQLLEEVRRHKVNIDGNICTVMVTILVVEGWQRRLDPDYDIMKTLQTLLFKVDWAESLIYTIEGLMAP